MRQRRRHLPQCRKLAGLHQLVLGRAQPRFGMAMLIDLGLQRGVGLAEIARALLNLRLELRCRGFLDHIGAVPLDHVKQEGNDQRHDGATDDGPVAPVFANGGQIGETMNRPAVKRQLHGLIEIGGARIGRLDFDYGIRTAALQRREVDRLPQYPRIALGHLCAVADCLPANGTIFVVRIACQKHDPIGIRHQDALGRPLPRRLQRIELDTDDRYAKQVGTGAHRFGEIVARAIALRLNAEIAAPAVFDRLLEIRLIR